MNQQCRHGKEKFLVLVGKIDNYYDNIEPVSDNL